jgi:3-methyladenine DNA glycosylase/8-oxoguanine DNA glycosylase
VKDAAAAIAHLTAVDPVLAALMARTEKPDVTLRPDPFNALVRSIMYQQLAGPAASAILRRFLAIWQNEYPTPVQLLAAPEEQLRAAGLSRQKLGYLRDLAGKFANGNLHELPWDALDDEAIISQLTTVKGIGRWSAEMFLMFSLGRPDVLPVDDLGVRKGMRKVYGLAELPKPAEMREIAEKWRPHRSTGSWYMWRALELMTLDEAPGVG